MVGRPRLTLDPEKTGIWISGREHLDMMIQREERTHAEKIAEIKNRIKRYHYKNVGKKQYLYLWEDGKHTYAGKKDPRPALAVECEARLKKWLSRKRSMQICIIKDLDGHLIIDLNDYKKWLYPKIPASVIAISVILELKK